VKPVRRCLHSFFVGLLTLSVVTAPAHACWRSRQARRCRPVHVVHACPTPVWSTGCDPCGGAIAEVVEVPGVAECCRAAPVARACCEETVVIAESHGGSGPVGWGHEEVVSSEASHPATSGAVPAEPTLTAESPTVPSLEPITPPLALGPAGGVTPASAEQPAEPPVAAPAAESVLTAPAGDVSADASATPALPVEPAAAAPAAEPPMTDEPKAADQPAAPAVVAEEPPAPQAPPEPEEVNIFEELETRKAAAPAADEMPEAPAAVDPFAAEPAEPAAPADEAPGPAAADPFAAAEPTRRWIDATETGSIVATLVSVVPEDHCVLETRGRRVVVPLENLSRHDRDYVLRAGERLATEGETAAAASPPVADTAGL